MQRIINLYKSCDTVKYIRGLGLRLISALIISIFGIYAVYFLLTLPTFFASYLTLFFYRPLIFGNFLIINSIKLEFIPACIAASAYVLFAILILLTKDIDLRKGVKMFLLGSLILFIVNILRIFVLAVALLEFDKRWFDTLHLFFWQIFSTLFVVITWVYLTKMFKVKTIPVYSDFKHLKNIVKIIPK